jgi:CHAT domain-containing protein/Tfp pilus assembly protein PilF
MVGIEEPMPRRTISAFLHGIVLLTAYVLVFPLLVNGQGNSKYDANKPPELMVVDPQIRALIPKPQSSCDQLNVNDTVDQLQEALKIADSHGLVRDRALVETSLASTYVSQAKIELAFATFQKALQDAIDSKNGVLEADLLIALASEAQLKGNRQQAAELVSRALSISEKNGSLYEKSHALGELGEIMLAQGKTDEGRAAIDEALQIDQLNGYRFEAIHLVYRAIYLGLAGKVDQALDSSTQAITRALEIRDAYSFVMAENTYSFALVKRGRAEEAVTDLGLLKQGQLQKFVPDAQVRACFASALNLPIFHLTLLEDLANALEAANKKEAELETWQEVYDYSRGNNFLVGEGEAAHKVADLDNQLKKNDDALKYYAIAADLYRTIQNEPLLAQVEVSESLLLIQVGRGKEALLLEQEVASYATRHSLREQEFLAYGVCAEIYQPAGELENARDTLEKALSLVSPGPFDDELDNHVVVEDYANLADVYKGLKNPTRELVAIDSAFFVAVHLKDEKAQQNLIAYLNQRLKDLGIRDLVVQRQKEGQLVESLVYSYVLFIHDGFPSKSTDDQSNLQRILNLPFQIARQNDGPSALKEILHDIGPLVGFYKLPVLSALARYYVTDGADPILAEKYELESESVLKNAKGDMTSLQAEAACILAISYSRQGKDGTAKDELEECTSLSKKTGDQQAISYSDVATILVQTRLGNILAAKSSLENLIAKSPENPELHIELATALASAKLYDEADSRLEYATQKLISLNDKKTAALAYARVATALNGDSSEKAQKLQLKYLESAQRLYLALGAPAEEAEILVVLGDYYLKVTQTKAAIDSYERAFGLAQKAGKSDIAAEGLLGLGNGYKAQNDFKQAIEYHRKAASAYHDLNNAEREAICLGDLEGDFYELGDTDRALSSLLEAKKVAEKAPVFNRYRVDYLLGDFYRSQGQFEHAFASFNEAVEITSQSGDLQHLAYSHNAIAALDTVIGSWDDAVSESQIALDLFQRIGSRQGQADCWALLTGVYCDRSSSLKDFDKAQECYAKAQDFGYGKTLQLDLMEIYLQTGKYSDAAKIANESFQDCQQSKNTECQSYALISLSEAERREGDLKASRSALNKARPIASQSPEIYLRGQFLYAEARLLVSEGKLDEGLASYEQLISLIESVKGNLSAQEQKSISENYGFIYDELVSLLYSMSSRARDTQSKFASESFEYAEVNKARQFAASWGRVFVNQMRLTLPPATQEREQSLYSRRDLLLAQLEATANIGESNQEIIKVHLKTELSSVQGEINEFLINLRKSAPQYAAIAYPEEVQISTLPLKQGETLVEFKMTDDATFVWIIQNRAGIQNDVVAFYRIPKKRDWFLDRLSVLRKGLNSGRAGAVDWRISEELFTELFPGDISETVSNSKEIIFVPDDVLFILPFELFSPEASNGNFVFLKKATTYYPSAASLRLARTASHQRNWQEAFLGLSDPITSPEDDRFEAAGALKSSENSSSNQAQSRGGELRSPNPDRLKARGFSFERLPGTAIEVQSIASLLTARNETVDVRSGATATKAELLDTDLSKFRFVHFATHGVLPVDTGIKEPSLVLSYDGVAPSHMFLSMSEIIGLKLDSESVVLSACNTGSGKISRAEGVMSLGRAFLAAGSSSVTVSLWQVSDDSTAVLMKKYYEGLLTNKKKSIALAEARYAVFESGSRDPFFWAPFIVIGE